MKTIDINLIGEHNKQQKKAGSINKTVAQVDEKTKVLSISFVAGACVVFVISSGVFLISNFLTQKAHSELKQLKSEHEKENQKLKLSVKENKDLRDDKKVLELKMVAKDYIDNTFIPWKKIITDISKTIPEEIVINKISKNSSGRGEDSAVNISGQIPAINGENPLKLVSFLIININENSQNSVLGDATLKSFKEQKESGKFEFEVTAALKSKNKESDEVKE